MKLTKEAQLVVNGAFPEGEKHNRGVHELFSAIAQKDPNYAQWIATRTKASLPSFEPKTFESYAANNRVNYDVERGVGSGNSNVSPGLVYNRG
ncbi:MAG: hypothetical protein COB76_06725 [Alphaproteobacteria bacterium]|nr:MAG: hypothetical protein COB76_06725 [Alphaproteobacteria bacterium]